MEKELLIKLEAERFARNMYYKDYQHAGANTEDFYMQMFLIHDYAYSMLCVITGQKTVSAIDDYNAAHGRRL